MCFTWNAYYTYGRKVLFKAAGQILSQEGLKMFLFPSFSQDNNLLNYLERLDYGHLDTFLQCLRLDVSE